MDIDLRGQQPGSPEPAPGVSPDALDTLPRLALPRGFVAHTGHAGLREDGGDDIAVIRSLVPCSSAAVFTQSRFAGPSVTLSRRRVASGAARAVVIVAKNANVATGRQGAADAEELTGMVARSCALDPDEVLIASTGVIGRPYPMTLLRDHLAGLAISPFDSDAARVARAIMTTDTVPKTAVQRAGDATVVGIAKGVGMIEPHMATMLAFAFTDAEIDPGTLDRMWRRAVDETFNCLSVDTDTSTSDTAAVFANGVSGPVPEAVMGMALHEVCLDLTLQLARDGEGATKLLTVTVRSARDAEQARRVAKAVVNSPLVKTAVHGADPNWGRVAMAIGKCEEQTDIDPERVVIRFGGMETYPAPLDLQDLDRLSQMMAADHVEIEVELQTGIAEATVYGCDLSAGYVRINADYTT